MNLKIKINKLDEKDVIKMIIQNERNGMRLKRIE